MNKLFEKIEGPMMKIGEKLNNVLFFKVLRDAFLLIFPIIIFGSIVIIIANFPFLGNIIGEDNAKTWANMLSHASLASVNIMAVFLAMGIGYHYAKEKNVEAKFCAAVCICGFFILFPWTSTTAINGGETAENYAAIANMGAKGMFVAIFASFFTSIIYTWGMNKNFQIKMPEQVPPAVSKSFASLIPATMALSAVLVVQVLFSFTPWDNIFNFVFTFVQAPLVNLGDGLAATVIAIFFAQIFWFFGLQGTSLVNSMLDPIYNTLMLENYSNYTQGLPVENICTKPFMEVFTIGLGGSGCTLIVVIMLVAIVRSKQLKSLGKIALPAGIFNVNEPFIFGLPVIFNPLVIIPWVIAPMVSVTIAYLALSWGLVPLTTGVSIPFTIPIFINGFLATNSIAGSILQLVQAAVVGLIWAPFIAAIDKKYFKQEQADEIKLKDNTSADSSAKVNNDKQPGKV